jgi:adenosylmethionine-8-amino-7-oxononanoate transaminase
MSSRTVDDPATMNGGTALWLPFTQAGDAARHQRRFVRGQEAFLIDAEGHRVFDAVSSIWTCVHGHSHPRIVAAIANQAGELDHSTLLGATNPVAEKLASRLCGTTGLDRVFFASDGASAVEAAIKMALQYWRNRGEMARSKIVRLVRSYHGDTIGAMSVSDIGVFKEPFADVCFQTESHEVYARRSSDADVAAIIVEPLVQAAAGMQIVREEDYSFIQQPSAPLLIVDEIATGFGRTGTMFAYQQTGLHPDILCLGKGITGGALPLSATIASNDVYAAFLSPHTADNRHFFHGHSYAGNPIACAAALASLDIFEVSDVLQRIVPLIETVAMEGEGLMDHPLVESVRHAGLMCGIVVSPPAGSNESASSFAWQVVDRLYERGFFTRPIGAVVQLVPPLSSDETDIRAFFSALRESLDHLS